MSVRPAPRLPLLFVVASVVSLVPLFAAEIKVGIRSIDRATSAMVVHDEETGATVSLGATNQPDSLKKSARTSRSRPELPIAVCRHDGKEARRMGRNTTGRRQGGVPDQNGDSLASPSTVKVTLHLTVGTAQRLGVESAMRRISQSAIAEEVLAAYLSRWQLPAVVAEADQLKTG
jgi:hypothetical protein